MATYSRQFINDKGESVSVLVGDDDRNGVKGVRIYITAPEEDSEIFVSRQEAVEVLEGLSRIMRTKNPR
jgi:hypothetical protein